jgi:DNA-binding response OmpR family regulator
MKKKIAIIEDDQVLAEMYKIKFETEGFEVRLADNGRMGLELLETYLPDVALVDLMMPEMTGEEMLHALRATDWGKQTRVIIMTNVSRDEAKIDLSKLDVSEYVVKAHTTPHQIIDITKRVLKQPAKEQ